MGKGEDKKKNKDDLAVAAKTFFPAKGGFLGEEIKEDFGTVKRRKGEEIEEGDRNIDEGEKIEVGR